MTHTHEFVARIEWTGARDGSTTDYKSYSRAYDISIDGRPVIKGSADPVFLGTDDRYNPEDLLVASLSACHMLSYLALCARKNIAVTAYQDDAWGKMEMKNGKLRFTEVILRPVVVISAASNLEKAIRLHHDAHETCFIANSVNFPVLNKANVTHSE
ncbi:OsmC family protein [Sneathiella sp.]|uniref:OsmC family protein n=1 Tax=Sneathiella sp. TaxID=1964365 RepID=UPI0026219089|nr:OsmC family protein [Sneathiella sp.]MDF2367565.1 OsmC family protein [Sneathiella sp.]